MSIDSDRKKMGTNKSGQSASSSRPIKRLTSKKTTHLHAKFGPELDSLSHHAYLFVGDRGVANELAGFLGKKHGVTIHGNPDFSRTEYENFTIDDARGLKASAETKPVSVDGQKIFILSMNSITVEAQNALLKLLEEPPEYARFFLIIPSAHLLLGTVKSRLQIIDTGSASKNSDSKEAEQFLKAPKPDRLEIIKDLLDDISKEKRLKQDAIDFLNNIQSAVYEKFGPKEGREKLEIIETSRRYMNDRAPSLKMLLEYVALNI